jgi:phage baseplate assembly protein gpV
MFHIGIVASQDVPNVRVRVTLTDRDRMQTYWLRVLQRNTQNNKDFWIPDVGEQVICLLDDCYETGYVLGSTYSSVDTPPASMTADKRHTTYSDGTTTEYDRALHVMDTKFIDGADLKYDAGGHHLTVSLPSGADLTVTANGASAKIDASGNITLSSPGTINVNAPTVNVDGSTAVVIAGGGPAVARIGDTVNVSDPDSGTLTGTIVSGSAKVTCG